ncbi:MAG: hypothetical protein ACD_71C00100G0001, partial [uncultured bacterium (gcode 4)]
MVDWTYSVSYYSPSNLTKHLHIPTCKKPHLSPSGEIFFDLWMTREILPELMSRLLSWIDDGKMGKDPLDMVANDGIVGATKDERFDIGI